MKTHKIISAVFALLIAMGLWAYTVVYVSPETTQSINGIPVQFRMEDILLARGLILTSGKDQSVSLTVSGRRSDLLKLNTGNVRVSADLSNITEPGSWDVTYDITYPDTVANGDVVVESKSPETVHVEVALAMVKTLKPDVVLTGTPAKGYLLDSVDCDVESITITGPSYEVEPISQMRVDVDVSGINASETRIYSYSLLDEKGEPVTLSNLTTVSATRAANSEGSGDEVVVTLPVLQYREVLLRPEYQNLADGVEVVRTSLSPQTILITGDSAALEKLPRQIPITVDMTGVTAQKEVWELNAIISLESGLVVYSNADEKFDGVNVKATVAVRATPEPETVAETEPDPSDANTNTT